MTSASKNKVEGSPKPWWNPTGYSWWNPAASKTWWNPTVYSDTNVMMCAGGAIGTCLFGYFIWNPFSLLFSKAPAKGSKADVIQKKKGKGAAVRNVNKLQQQQVEANDNAAQRKREQEEAKIQAEEAERALKEAKDAADAILSQPEVSDADKAEADNMQREAEKNLAEAATKADEVERLAEEAAAEVQNTEAELDEAITERDTAESMLESAYQIYNDPEVEVDEDIHYYQYDSADHKLDLGKNAKTREPYFDADWANTAECVDYIYDKYRLEGVNNAEFHKNFAEKVEDSLPESVLGQTNYKLFGVPLSSQTGMKAKRIIELCLPEDHEKFKADPTIEGLIEDAYYYDASTPK